MIARPPSHCALLDACSANAVAWTVPSTMLYIKSHPSVNVFIVAFHLFHLFQDQPVRWYYVENSYLMDCVLYHWGHRRVCATVPTKYWNNTVAIHESIISVFQWIHRATTKIWCNGPQYGKNLNVEDCKQTFQSITKSSNQVSFGERRTAVSYDFNVPHRFSSGR